MHVAQRAPGRIVAALAVIVALIATWLVAMAPQASATFPGSEGKIAFTRGGNDNFNIWSVNPDGTGEQQLTTSTKDSWPVWSPDGTRIAFLSQRDGQPEVYLMDADGSHQTRLTTDQRYKYGVSWTADQKAVAYSDTGALVMVDVQTGQKRTLLDPPDFRKDYYFAMFSPDGSSLAYLEQDYVAGADGRITEWSARIFLAKRDGTEPRLVLERRGDYPISSNNLTWAPSGSQLEWTYSIRESRHMSFQLDGTVIRDVPIHLSGWEVSPVGNRTVRSIVQNGSIGLYLADLDGNPAQRITNLAGQPGFDEQPAWQPVGFQPVDYTAPSITISRPVSEQLAQGATVLASYGCTDDVGGSGMASCVGSVTNGTAIDTSTAGTKTFTVTARDNAGNQTVKTVEYTVVAPPPPADTTAPIVTVTSPVENGETVMGAALTASYSCADEVNGSGVASCVGTVANGGGLDTSGVGTKTFTVTARDNAGNQTVKTVSYRVIWPFSSFTGPVDPLPTLNTSKAGGVIPVRFSLGGDRGMDILAAGYPRSTKITCDGSAPADAIEEVALSPGSNALTYDAATGQYGYNWKTDKTWKGTCRQLTFMLADGASYRANFKFN